MGWTYGLGSDWDEDLYPEGGSASTRLLAELGPKAKGRLGGPGSKASELLRRASEASKAAQGVPDDDLTQQVCTEDLQTEVLLPHADAIAPIAFELHRTQQADRGLFDDAGHVEQGDEELQVWTSRAPKALGLCGSVRGSMRSNGLLAKPAAGPDGTFRIQLFRLGSPDGCRKAVSSLPTAWPKKASLAEGLLQAQIDCRPVSEQSQSLASGVPLLISPAGLDGKALLEHYCKSAFDCFGEHGEESFQLLGALYGRGDKERPQLSLSAWLARANVRTVRRHLDRTKPSSSGSNLRLSATGSDGPVPDLRHLESAFHLLTANHVCAALQELRAAAGHGPQFDRLAAVLSACGGASLPGTERSWLRQQLEEWRRQGMQDLMGQELWRLYSLLAGDLQEVVGDTLDWRTAFGIFLWYGAGGEKEVSGPSMNDDVPRKRTGAAANIAQAVEAFQAAVKLHGSSCRFRPVPAHVRSAVPRLEPVQQTRMCEGIARGRSAPSDIQFNALRVAAGLAPLDISLFDYATYSSDPMDVALSWHFSVLLLALKGGEEAASASAGQAFQRLTQQYCQALELQGLSQWAVYVAHFVSEGHARAALVRRLVHSHAKSDLGLGSLCISGQPGVDEAPKPHWPGVPASWLWRARALSCEETQNWSGALACWLRSGEAGDRAVTIATCYLVGPTMLGHASAPFQRGSAEAIMLSPMNSAARWLLAALEKLAPAMAYHDSLWSDVGREALGVFRHWSTIGKERFVPGILVRLYWRCELLRRGTLGLPW
eukprot:TRINITY_DN43374_c0_g1_i1.p1 TRINITY_DN43374_c0_g1~~TRINITY_DN43374_c0_g1_i1.p1  ORF type:complete len:771 (-),score=129.86 TRINITY_DN43374_c0_g1_i1:63-2375(-)